MPALLEALLEDEITEQLVKPKFRLVPPRIKTRVSPRETITSNKYDIVLVCQPDALDHYRLYDEIEKLVEDRKKLRIYCPHRDFIGNRELSEVVDFTVKEAIPRTRIVLVHLTTITPEIQEMFDATYLNNRSFLLFYAEGTEPFNQANARNIRYHPCYRGEFSYFNDAQAIRLLDDRIDGALGVE